MSLKIAVIGAGNVGAAVAYAITIRNLAAEVSLIDINEHKEAGEVMDIADGLCFLDTGCVRGADFKEAKNADIIILTAGANQKDGDTRLDLLEKNKEITKAIFKSIGKIKKDAIVIVVTNPVDVITHLAQKITGLPAGQVFGTGTALDTARLKTNIAHELGVSAKSVSGYVLGEHGDSEFVAWSSVHVGSSPISEFKAIGTSKRNKIEMQVRKEAYEIIKRKGATFFGIATATAEIVEAIAHDQHIILPVSTCVKKWNGVSDLCIGIPAVIGRTGVERVWMLALSAEEKKKLAASANILKSYIKKL